MEGENAGKGALRNVDKFLITPEEFEKFCTRHRHLDCFVAESSELMMNSYLILDENMCFLNCDIGPTKKVPSRSIFDVGVKEALKESGFDESMFYQRGGLFEWTRTLANDGECQYGCNSGKNIKTLNDW